MDHQQKDETAVAYLATAMNTKLARARAKGRSGWDSPECTQQHLSNLLREHVEKGDPVDVANFCAFLAARGETIAPRQCLTPIEEPPATAAVTPQGEWRIDASTGRGILVYKNCSVIEAEQAPYVLGLIAADAAAAHAPALEAPAAPPPRTTGYIAPKGRYVPPVLFDPYTGEPRDARDIASDPQGVLIVPPGAAIQPVREG